ncbi:MAG: YHS domain-containing (seleno)protein [Phycisphaerae bacterium]
MTRRTARNFVLLAALSTALSAIAAAAPPDFTVGAGDKQFRLADARGKFVAIHFLLKTECPICLRYTTDMVRRGPEIAGVQHVFLKPDPEADVKQWAEKIAQSGIDVSIYRDADTAIAKQFSIPDGYAFHGETVHYPALVLVGPDGNEMFRYVGKSNTDRMPFDQLVEQVQKHSANAALKAYNLSEGAIALQGRDPVTYFEGGKPVVGKSDLLSRYRGVTYQFASPDNRAKFAADPEKFAPAYGGWCATAMAEGDRVEIDPANFKITNGRLFLFYKGWLGNALNDWNKAETKLTVDADRQWNKIAPSDTAKPK